MANTSERLRHADRVFAHLCDQNRPLSACDIVEDLRAEGITAATTVYRAFDRLLTDCHVRRIESLNAWTAYRDPSHTAPPTFEICDDCGSVTDVVDEDLSRTIAVLSERTGFKPNRSVIELHGRFGGCHTDVPNA